MIANNADLGIGFDGDADRCGIIDDRGRHVAADRLLALLARQPIVRLALLQMTGIWAFILIGVGLPGLLINFVKRAIGRGRPLNLEDPDAPVFQYFLNDWTYQSFPSGHATTAFAFCFVVSFLVPRGLPWMLAISALIAFSRIAIGAHYPTDVLGGFLIGAAWAALCASAAEAVERRRATGGPGAPPRDSRSI